MRLVFLPLTIAVVVAVAGCGAPASQTPTFVKTRDSNYGQIGDVRLLHVHLATPPRQGWQPGDTVPLHLTLTNDGAEPVTLIGVSSPRATRVVHEAAGGSTEEIRIRMEPGQTVSLQENDPGRLALVGLTDRVMSGVSVPITFTIDTGEAVTLAVPAQASTQPRTR
ncbi:MAG: copper chaperone PCu(A)C [Pseudonocardia sp.]|nr:copper chaperone PCu(A)C [Pseudonocardia sp.]